MNFTEVSACTGENITEVFEEIGKRAVHEIPPEENKKAEDCKFGLRYSNLFETRIEFYRRTECE